MTKINIKPSDSVVARVRRILSWLVKFNLQGFLLVSVALYVFYPKYDSIVRQVHILLMDGGMLFAKEVQKVSERLFPGDSSKIVTEELRGQHLDSAILLRVLREENMKLRKMLNFLQNYRELSYITTRVVGRVGYDGVTGKVLLPVGYESGIRDNQAVVNERGLVGKTIDVGRRSAKLLLITDKSFRVPVTMIGSGVSAILAGTGEGTKLTRLSSMGSGTHDGEILVTIGNSEGFPYGVYVGYVLGGEVATKVNLKELDFVSIVSTRIGKPILLEEERGQTAHIF